MIFKQIGHYFQNIILLYHVVHCEWNILECNYPNSEYYEYLINTVDTDGLVL